MRVMFVITRGNDLGGAQSYVRDVARRFSADGHEVHVVAGATGALTDALAAAGIATSACPGLLRQIHPLHDPRAVRHLTRLIRAYRPDLVSCHSSKAGMIGRIAARMTGTPCLFTVHGWAFIDTVPWPVRTAYRWMERSCARLADRIVCVSEQVRQMGIDAGIDPATLTLIHNGLPDVALQLRADPGAGQPRAIMVARFAAPKDHATVIRALAQVPELQLDFVGDGPDEAAARQLAAETGVAGRIAFLGRRTDVPHVLARSHIFVLSSLSEAFPISTLEAMRAGLPTVVANVGGAGEAVRHGETGLLFERGDAAELAARLRVLAADPALRARMGARARARFEAEFTFERMYRATYDVYRAALRPAVVPEPVMET